MIIERISICSSYNVIARETKRIHLIIILYTNTLNETCTNPKLFTSFVPSSLPQSLFTYFSSLCHHPRRLQIKIKGHGSRVSPSIHIHESLWVLSQFEAAGSRNKSISPLEYIGKVCSSVRGSRSLLSCSVTRFVPRRSRKNTREARSPRLCPLCQRRRRNYFAATVDGNAAVWVRRRSREAALACLPRISYFLSCIVSTTEEVGPASSVSRRSWLNWTGEFFSPFWKWNYRGEFRGKKRRFVPGLESKEIGLFEATCCCF